LVNTHTQALDDAVMPSIGRWHRNVSSFPESERKEW